MKVFKFGGASIKDYKSIIRLSRIIRKENHDRMILIVSAMGKTTNSMEKLVLSYLNSFKNFNDKLELIKTFHLDIIKNLFKMNDSSIKNIVQNFLVVLVLLYLL